MAQAPGAAMALATFELENNVQPVDGNDGSRPPVLQPLHALTPAPAVFRYDAAAQRAADQQKPWRDNPHYFKQCAPCTARPTRLTLVRALACASLRWLW